MSLCAHSAHVLHRPPARPDRCWEALDGLRVCPLFRYPEPRVEYVAAAFLFGLTLLAPVLTPQLRPSTAASAASSRTPSGAAVSRRHRHGHERRAQDCRYGRDERVGNLCERTPAAGHLRGQGRAHGFQVRRAARGQRQRRHADAARFRLEFGQLTERSRSPAVRRCSRPTAPTSRRTSIRSSSPNCRCSTATSPSSSC